MDVDIKTSGGKEETEARKKLPDGCPPEGVPALTDGDVMVFGV